MEAAGLGVFMISAGGFATLLWHPQSPVAIESEWLKLLLMGAAMGVTAIGLIYSPWGKRSGAHLNPAVTLSLLYLRKIAPIDAAFYVLAQFAGGLGGVCLIASVVDIWLDAPAIWYVPTVPGQSGPTLALITEGLMSAAMMAMALTTSDSPRFKRLTGVFAGLLLTVYITFGSAVSGMSINPARTVASAIPSGVWSSVWIYFVGPIVGMFFVAVLYRTLARTPRPDCTGMNHHAENSCVYECGERFWKKENTA